MVVASVVYMYSVRAEAVACSVAAVAGSVAAHTGAIYIELT